MPNKLINSDEIWWTVVRAGERAPGRSGPAVVANFGAHLISHALSDDFRLLMFAESISTGFFSIHSWRWSSRSRQSVSRPRLSATTPTPRARR